MMTKYRAALPALLAALILPACTAFLNDPPAAASDQLDRLQIIVDRPDVPGYDRSCSRGHSCSFGSAWSDKVRVRQGGNGCDQASDVIRTSLVDVVIKPGTHGCTPLSGTLHDPYTGKTIHYRRGQRPTQVSVDHVVSLKAAWDLGAADWPLQERRDLAGDPDNLIAVSAAANSSKGDDTPSDDWRPRRAFRCDYATRYVGVLAKYRLPVTHGDKKALKQMLGTCPATG